MRGCVISGVFIMNVQKERATGLGDGSPQ